MGRGCTQSNTLFKLLELGYYPMLANLARMERILGFGSVKASEALNQLVAIVIKCAGRLTLAFTT